MQIVVDRVAQVDTMAPSRQQTTTQRQYKMQKFQRFIVSWTSRITGEHYAEYNSLEEATLKYDQLKKISSDEYVYLSVVIDYE